MERDLDKQYLSMNHFLANIEGRALRMTKIATYNRKDTLEQHSP